MKKKIAKLLGVACVFTSGFFANEFADDAASMAHRHDTNNLVGSSYQISTPEGQRQAGAVVGGLLLPVLAGAAAKRMRRKDGMSIS